MTKEHQQLRVEIKALANDGTFDGLLSVYNVLDAGNDIVEPGAFTKTIQERGGEVVLLWQHKSDQPIGKLTLVDGPDALRVKGALLLELPEAKKAYLLIKAGIVKGLSIGFESVKDMMEGSIRRLKEVKLWEGSIVTFPMNEAALITAVKARLTKDDFNTELAETQLQDSGYQIMCALRNALSSVLWADMTTEERVAASQTIIEQFSIAYMAYLPLYLAMQDEMYYGGSYDTMSAEQRQERKEAKKGAAISAANRAKIQDAHDHATKACESLKALLTDEAGTADKSAAATSKAAEAAQEVKTEPAQDVPVVDHSALEHLFDDLRSVIPPPGKSATQ